MTTNPFLSPRRDGVFVVKLLAAAFCFLSMSLASAAETNEQAVLAAHEHRRTATLAGDAATVGSMMTDDFTFTHPDGMAECKAQFLDALKIGRLEYKTLTDAERRVRVHGDAGIVSGTCRIVVTASGAEFDVRVLFTEVWVKKGTAWQMVLWHATNVPSR